MKRFLLLFAAAVFHPVALPATTITVVPVHEPLSLHGTDGDEVISDIGEALQASVMARPMALTGAFPETLVESVRSPHMIPTNNRNYKVTEANLLVLCKIGISAEKTKEGLAVKLDVGEMIVPTEVDLTPRQILRLAIVAVRRTLEDYQKHQDEPLEVTLHIDGAIEKNKVLGELDAKFTVPAAESGE